MKLFPLLLALVATSLSLHAGESALTTTYQPLVGLGDGGIRIVPVTCHDWYSHSGMPTQILLISARNVPPTNHPKEATADLNLASVYGLHFIGSPADINGKGRQLILSAAKVKDSTPYGLPKEQILRASLECLRLALPPEYREQALKLEAPEAHAAWMDPIVKEFNAHDRTKVFFTQEE